ncbi:MAG: glycosyltransferase [Bacteroidales bacterium]|nr:glycosyltransferase [Bacteroidales bacterium]
MMNVRRFDIPLRVSGDKVRAVAASADGDYTLIYTKPTDLRWVYLGLERMVSVADQTGAAMVYSDHFSSVDGVDTPTPVIDCQKGALRDDFDFGGVMLFRTSVLRKCGAQVGDWKYAGLYDLRLRASLEGDIVHINEYLYYEVELDTRKSGEKLFDYVDPRNREVQIEMEKVCTAHLKSVGAWLPPVFRDVDLNKGEFPVEASVVIPCRNRVRTIGDAIRSALSQDCPFAYNVIVVDDNSSDGTVEVIRGFDDERLIYIAQDPSWHAIGGNWNAAIFSPRCGRFALQLDSDDVYSGPDTIRRFVEAFYEQNCAMVIGSYRITDFNLNELPPGVIDHREWTDDNGRNNALRINGLGAPRGFWTPLLREIGGFPTVKYGEDYAVALRISREYRIGRIYDVMYNCRRWDDNSDAALDVEKMNANNLYKDRIRTWELAARMSR